MGYFNLRPWKKAPELPAKTVEPGVPPTSILLRRAEEYQQMVADVLEAGASEDELPIAEPVANGVVEMWSIDRGDHFEHLSQRHLDQAGLSFRVSYPDDPDLCASFILVADEWLDTSSLLGEAVYAVGTRTLLHVCGSEDAAGSRRNDSDCGDLLRGGPVRSEEQWDAFDSPSFSNAGRCSRRLY